MQRACGGGCTHAFHLVLVHPLLLDLHSMQPATVPCSAVLCGRTALIPCPPAPAAVHLLPCRTCVRIGFRWLSTTPFPKPLQVDNFGNTAMSEAVKSGHAGVVDILLLHGGRQEGRRQRGGGGVGQEGGNGKGN